MKPGYRARRNARRFRRGQPGFVGCAEGSINAIVCYSYRTCETTTRIRKDRMDERRREV